MPTDTITTLFSHNLWANVGLFECCTDLTNEQLDATISGTFGTIRETLQRGIEAPGIGDRLESSKRRGSGRGSRSLVGREGQQFLDGA